MGVSPANTTIGRRARTAAGSAVISWVRPGPQVTEATADNFQVFVKPRCDPAVAAFGPVQWRLERGQIILQSKNGDTWQFEADDNAQWRRVPDSADGLVMLRGQ